MNAIPQFDSVKDLQSDLVDRKVLRGRIDGLFGPLTLAALMQSRDDTPKWLRLAAGELGVSEIVGRRHNPRIVEYHSYCDLRATNDEVPWCSSFVNWTFGVLDMTRTDKATARSWLEWGKEREAFGCVYVMSRGKSRWTGHVGFLLARIGERYAILGGNQSNRVSVAFYPVSKHLGYRWPV